MLLLVSSLPKDISELVFVAITGVLNPFTRINLKGFVQNDGSPKLPLPFRAFSRPSKIRTGNSDDTVVFSCAYFV